MKKQAGVKLDEVTHEWLKRGARAFLMHPLVPVPKSHIDPPPPGSRIGLVLCEGWKGKDETIADNFTEELKKGETCPEGFRYGVVGWPHTKLRFLVKNRRFWFYLRANVDRAHSKDVMEKCRVIALDMTAIGFPTKTG